MAGFLSSIRDAVFGPSKYQPPVHHPETDYLALTKILADLGENCATVPDHVLPQFTGTMYALLELENRRVVKRARASYDGLDARISVVTNADPLAIMADIYSFYDNGNKMTRTETGIKYGTINLDLVNP